jgi:hypothetical protein
MTVQTRLPFELDQRAEAGVLTAHGGVPLLIEAFRTSGAAGVPAISRWWCCGPVPSITSLTCT